MNKQPLVKTTTKLEVISVENHRYLPSDVEMVLYEPPYKGEPVEATIKEFNKKYGFLPKKVYQIGKQIYIVLEEKHG